MSYVVKTETFEGPLDLLLDLIEKQQLDITRVSLATITNEYIAFVQAHRNISLTHLADFLSVAAKLLLIKSKALLPLLQYDQEEESDLAELERQLLALRAIKDIVPVLQRVMQSATPRYARSGLWGVTPQFAPGTTLNAQGLADAFRVSLSGIPQLDALEEKIISDIISLEQRISDVQEMVARRGQSAFSAVIKDASSPQEVIVSFLALLELVKQQIISVRQEELFADIALELNAEYTKPHVTH